MRDTYKTKKQLIRELEQIRRKLAELKAQETELKQTVETLQRSRNYLDCILNGMYEAVMVIDRNYRIKDINNCFTRLYNRSREEIIDRKCYEITHASSKPCSELEHPCPLQEVIRTRLPTSCVHKHKSKDGDDLIVGISGFALLNSTGEVEFIVEVQHDITEYKRAEESLKESEQRYRQLFEGINDAIIVDDQEEKFVDCNQITLQRLGYSREEFLSLRAADIIHPDFHLLMKSYQKRIWAGETTLAESAHLSKDGRVIPVEVHGRKIEYSGKPAILIVARDITERKQAEAKAREVETLRELDKLRTELLANVSHELRTPLASIKGFTTMLLDYDKGLKRDEKREYLVTIDKNANRLAELIRQLLDMSQLGAGILPIDKAPATIGKLCREAVFEAQVKSPPHRFVLDLPKRLPRVNIDARRIRQVLDNLIGNAVNYSEAGTEVTVAVQRVKDELLISVTDQGIGIPEKNLPRVFERMFRSQQRTLSGEGGAGLGLSICKGLVETHGGSIWIESEEGKGTKCFFTLPIYAK